MKRALQIVLGLVIVALGYFLYSSIMEPVKFDNEYNKRRDACAEKLKVIRLLEDTYKDTYGVYTGSFDTLFTRLFDEDSMRFTSKQLDWDAITRDGADSTYFNYSEADQQKKGYLKISEIYVNPIQQLKNENKLDASLTREQIENYRYAPYPKGEKLEFTLNAGLITSHEVQVSVVECKVALKDLMRDYGDQQLIINKIDEYKGVADYYPGWKFGSLEKPITDGNFE